MRIWPVILFYGSVAAAELPLHERVDPLIAAGQKDIVVAPLCDDATFLRRVSLDFAGEIPAPARVRSFLADKKPDKRRRLIEELLNGPRYAERMTDLFHLMLMERRGDHEKWRTWLKQCFGQNQPWDRMAEMIIRADHRDEAKQGAAFFYTKRLEKYGQNPTDYPGLTRDVGRLFLGRDLQCAQCHNHRKIDDYNQSDFQGLFAAYQNLKLHSKDLPAVAEGVMAEKLEYASVFTQKKRTIGPKVPGLAEFAIETYDEKDGYIIVADKKAKTPGVPRFSPLEKFAEGIPRSPDFAKNMVNRLWFHLMGRGLVEPLDQHHAENPATHPELLDALAQDFVRYQFDLKWLMRELALTQTYQRSSRLESDAFPPPEVYAVAMERRLSAEQLFRSTLMATGHDPEALDDEKKKDLLSRFQKAMGNEAKEPELEFDPKLKGALFMLNDQGVQKLVYKGSIVSEETKVEDLYLQILSRFPTEKEKQTLEEYLDEHAARRAEAIGDAAWAMLTSTEFVVNH